MMIIELSIDRLNCLTQSFLEILKSEKFVSIRLDITDDNWQIYPIAGVIKIVTGSDGKRGSK